MNDNTKKAPYKRKMVVTFINGHTRSVILKGDFEDMDEKVVSYVGEALRDNEPFRLTDDNTIINPRNITAVTFGPVEELDGA